MYFYDDKQNGFRKSYENCLGNQSIEGFGYTLKSDYYYRNRFITHEELETDISEYLDYYMNKILVPKFDSLTPSGYRKATNKQTFCIKTVSYKFPFN
ncbi:IS3 family transposase [Staphylococcus succinus]|uniref:IS3 family transposase n=1 Tax=Staphylococcus succinus TaxID=61015 RepID=UPI0009370716